MNISIVRFSFSDNDFRFSMISQTNRYVNYAR